MTGSTVVAFGIALYACGLITGIGLANLFRGH